MRATHAPRLAAAFVAIAAFFGLASSAFAGVNDFIGTWTNPAPQGGVTQVFVEQDRFKVRIRMFGQCHPHDCDWGWADAQVYSPNAGGNPWQDGVAMIARYDSGFSHRVVIFHRRGQGGMSYEIYTDFNDNSHRAPYVEEGGLRRDR